MFKNNKNNLIYFIRREYSQTHLNNLHNSLDFLFSIIDLKRIIKDSDFFQTKTSLRNYFKVANMFCCDKIFPI